MSVNALSLPALANFVRTSTNLQLKDVTIRVAMKRMTGGTTGKREIIGYYPSSTNRTTAGGFISHWSVWSDGNDTLQATISNISVSTDTCYTTGVTRTADYDVYLCTFDVTGTVLTIRRNIGGSISTFTATIRNPGNYGAGDATGVLMIGDARTGGGQSTIQVMDVAVWGYVLGTATATTITQALALSPVPTTGDGGLLLYVQPTALVGGALPLDAGTLKATISQIVGSGSPAINTDGPSWGPTYSVPDTTAPTSTTLTTRDAGETDFYADMSVGADATTPITRQIKVYSDAGHTTQVGSTITVSTGVTAVHITGLPSGSATYYIRGTWTDSASTPNTTTVDTTVATTEPVPDTTGPTETTLSLHDATTATVQVDMSVGYDPSGPVTRQVMVYSDSDHDDQVGSTVTVGTGVTSFQVTGLSASTTYYIKGVWTDSLSNQTVAYANATTLDPPPAPGKIRALRLYGTQTVATPLSSAIPKTGDMTMRIVSKRLEFDRRAHRYVALVDASGNERFVINANLSPYAVVQVRSSAAGPTYEVIANDVSSSQIEFTDWVAVYKAPTVSTNGYLSLFRDGAYVNMQDANPGVYSDTTIVIPMSDTATWSGDLKLVIGGHATDATIEQAFEHCEIALWNAALTPTEVAALHDNSVNTMTTVPQASALVWYARPALSPDGTIHPDKGTLTTLYATPDSGVGFVADVPSWLGTPDDVALPTVGTVAVTDVGTGALTMNIGAGSCAGGACKRMLIISKSPVWRYNIAAREVLGSDGSNLTAHVLSGLSLTAGTKYYAIVRYEGANGLRAESSTSFTTPGSPPAIGTGKSLRITGVAQAVGLHGTGDIYHVPLNNDVTFRVMIRRNAGDPDGVKTFIRFVDESAASGGVAAGYYHLALNQTGSGFMQVAVQSGQRATSADSSTKLTVGTWEEIWVTYQHPTSTADGFAKIYRTATSLTTPLASVTIPYSEDWSWHKLRSSIGIGGFVSGSPSTSTDYNLADIAVWTKALSDSERTALSNRSISAATDTTSYVSDYLYWYCRPTENTNVLIPDLGAAKGAINMLPNTGISTGAMALEPPFTAGTGTIGYTTDMPAYSEWPSNHTYSLRFSTQPGTAEAGSAFGQQPVVEVIDETSARATGYSGTVGIAIKSGTGTNGATLSGVLSVSISSGLATFSGLSIDTAGTAYRLTASSTGLTSVDSNTFDVATPTPPPDTAGPVDTDISTRDPGVTTLEVDMTSGSDETAPITRQVMVYTDSDHDNQLGDTIVVGSGVTTFQITGLTAETTYYLMGVWTDNAPTLNSTVMYVTGTTLPAPDTTPPTDTTISTNSPTQTTLEAAMSVGTDASAPVTRRVTVYSDASHTVQVGSAITVGSGVTSIHITGLDGGSDYYIRGQWTDAVGNATTVYCTGTTSQPAPADGEITLEVDESAFDITLGNSGYVGINAVYADGIQPDGMTIELIEVPTGSTAELSGTIIDVNGLHVYTELIPDLAGEYVVMVTAISDHHEFIATGNYTFTVTAPADTDELPDHVTSTLITTGARATLREIG